jgi:uncharacterized protein YjbI with pentapeptide repeats
MIKIRKPNPSFISLITQFGRETKASAQTVNINVNKKTKVEAPSLLIGDLRLIFFDVEDAAPFSELQSVLNRTLSSSLEQDRAYEVLFVAVSGLNSNKRSVLSRGVSLVPLHLGLAHLLGLPDAWFETQYSLISRTLEPVSVNEVPKLANLSAKDESNSHKDANTLIRDLIGGWRHNQHPLCYLRAEAGKGKSTLLAFAVLEEMRRGTGPLPLFIPLRALQRGRGVSWEEICATIGVVGSHIATIAAGVRSGLVALILDGLDEVAGRYDPSIVKQVVDVISAVALSRFSKIVISGRTTEVALLPPSSTAIFGLELPDGSDPAFFDYAEIVVADITPKWPLISSRVPEPPISSMSLPMVDPSERDRNTIVEWLQILFDDFGKDRSLFFVQSLACLGRTRQLDGNKPLLIYQKPTMRVVVARPPLYNVTILAAALACIREQDKIEDIAAEVYMPARQLELLMVYALIASAQSSIVGMFPTPNEAARLAFALDPVNQNEEFTAVLRQMQKHALLLASAGEGIRAAEWRPQFLSDWIRCALLTRALLHKAAPCCGLSRESVIQAIASAERARIAYEFLIPDIVQSYNFNELEPLISALALGISQNNPEASANYWALFAGLSERQPLLRVVQENSLIPFTDLSGLVFNGVDFPPQFSGTYTFLFNTEASGCSYTECHFSQCDFSLANFRGCTFDNVVFEFCDGPIYFEDCRFKSCQFINGHGGAIPVYSFEGCHFDGGNRILQKQEVGGGVYGPVASFRESICIEDPPALIGGDFIGIPILPPPGLMVKSKSPIVPPEVSCLRALLSPFFPPRAGTQGDLQARGYIRTSAVGRGLFPSGTPNSPELAGVLFAFGFTDGGRKGHIYAPWSQVVGGGQEAFEFRNELIAFLFRGEQGPKVKQMLSRLRESGHWLE